VTHPFDQQEKWCETHQKQKVITKHQQNGMTIVTLECPECATVELLREGIAGVKELHEDHPPGDFADCPAAECEWARRAEEYIARLHRAN
jgi:hypothetical protein